MPPKKPVKKGTKTFVKPRPIVQHTENPLKHPGGNVDPQVLEANAKWLRGFIECLERKNPVELASMGLEECCASRRENIYAFNLDLAHWNLVLCHTHAPQLRLGAVRGSFHVLFSYSARLAPVERSRDLLIYALLATSLHELGEYETAEQFYKSVVDSAQRQGVSLETCNVGWRSEIMMRSNRSMNYRKLGDHASADREEAMVVQQIKDQRFEHKPDDLRKLTFVDGQATPVTREADKILANMVVPTIKADGSAWLPGGTRMSLPQQLVPKQWLVFDKSTKQVGINTPFDAQVALPPTFPYLHMPKASDRLQIDSGESLER